VMGAVVDRRAPHDETIVGTPEKQLTRSGDRLNRRSWCPAPNRPDPEHIPNTSSLPRRPT
jgi:hypothetical protein